MVMNTKIYFSSLILMLSTFTLLSQDIKSNTSGFSASISGVYSSWDSESFFLSDLAELDPSGYGLSVEVGYGINQRISFVVSYAGLNFNRNDNWNNFNFKSFSLLSMFNFGATLSAFRPFLEVGLSSLSQKIDPVTLDNTGAYVLRNSGLQFIGGGGLDYFVMNNLAIGLKAQFVSGSFSSNEIDGIEIIVEEDVDVLLFNLNLGIKYYFD